MLDCRYKVILPIVVSKYNSPLVDMYIAPPLLLATSSLKISAEQLEYIVPAA
jgi:hypothetical protein